MGKKLGGDPGDQRDILHHMENIYPFMDTEGNVATRDEEKAKVFNGFFASVFNRETSYPQGTPHPELEGENEGRIYPP